MILQVSQPHEVELDEVVEEHLYQLKRLWLEIHGVHVVFKIVSVLGWVVQLVVVDEFVAVEKRHEHLSGLVLQLWVELNLSPNAYPDVVDICLQELCEVWLGVQLLALQQGNHVKHLFPLLDFPLLLLLLLLLSIKLALL